MPKHFDLVWTNTALLDLEGTLDYISTQDSEGVAFSVHDKIMAHIETLTEHPSRCRTIPELREIGGSEFRELLVGPYRVPFRVDQSNVVIVGVLDGRRDLEEILLERAMRI